MLERPHPFYLCFSYSHPQTANAERKDSGVAAAARDLPTKSQPIIVRVGVSPGGLCAYLQKHPNEKLRDTLFWFRSRSFPGVFHPYLAQVIKSQWLNGSCSGRFPCKDRLPNPKGVRLFEPHALVQ